MPTDAKSPSSPLASDIPVYRNAQNSRDATKSLMRFMESPTQEGLEVNIEEQKICEACDEKVAPIWNCSYCGMDFCDPCWTRQAPHKPGRTGPDGLPHEKASPSVVRRFKDILTPPKERKIQAALHKADEDSTWFGISPDKDNNAMFQDYGRYSEIMAQSNTGEHSARYPQLVSFIGQTGAGKSTLIRMLIEQQENKLPSQDWKFATPVVGSITTGNVPTSGDVHLYSDPSTYHSAYPMLLADCEGFEGGENVPISAQYCDQPSFGVDNKTKDRDNKLQSSRFRGMPSSRRALKWATSEEKKKRQYSVTELYPRLLYTFSDVIVFVLRNPKTFESTVLSAMINWARSSIEKSLNQPTLPHVVIALNVTDTRIDKENWDPEHATNNLMTDVAGAVDRDPLYKELKTFWTERGKTIVTMQDLLECYYSSITVVRIPGDGRYMMINDQVQTLHDTLSRRCRESLLAKRRSRMLSTSENLNIYLQSAFDHFSTDLDTPFNFMDVSLQINPIPLGFGGTILKLAVALKRRFDDPRTIFEELSVMVASSILLDCVRQNIKGPPQQVLEKHYLAHCDEALERFCASHWPCAFRGKNNDRCVNIQGSHTKGHQNAKGKVMLEGPFQSEFKFEDFSDRWFQSLQQHLTAQQADSNAQLMQPLATTELTIVTRLHHAAMQLFYQKLGGAQRMIDHQSCLSCLRELAEHPLPCGHVLCTACVKGYGKPHPNIVYAYAMASCPLHQRDTVFPVPWPIAFKPPLAGVRVLSLDGGGIRGLVLIEVLARIQGELGDRIPIQDFFDLIVGTSTGGIVALALGVKDWPIAQCRKSFSSLTGRAFNRRIPHRFMRSKYQSKDIMECLTETFGEESMFGGEPTNRARGCARKVAVTACTETGESAVIFANYNRRSDSEMRYKLVQPENPDNGLKIREAARATSAAPTYFKPFVNPRTKESWVDGAVHYNNPVRIANYESMLLWPETKGNHPDILLSIGTAYNEQHPDEKPKKKKKNYKPYSEPRSWAKLIRRRIKDFLDAEQIWKTFRDDVVGNSSPIVAQRFVRVNPKLIIPVPKLDDHEASGLLRNAVGNSLASAEMTMLVEKVAHRLIASSFYFDKTSPTKVAGGATVIEGVIRCRFGTDSENLRYLGEHIKQFRRSQFQPYFRVHEVTYEEHAQDIRFDRNVLEDMIEILDFRIKPITVPVSSENALVSMDLHLSDNSLNPELRNGFPISGFPRGLADEEPLKKHSSVPAPPLPPPALPAVSKRQSLLALASFRRPSEESMRRKATSASQLRANQDKSVTKSDEDTDETPPRTSEDTLSGAFPRLPSSQVSIRSAVSLHQVNEVDEQIDKSLARVGEEGKEVVRIDSTMQVREEYGMT